MFFPFKKFPPFLPKNSDFMPKNKYSIDKNMKTVFKIYSLFPKKHFNMYRKKAIIYQ